MNPSIVRYLVSFALPTIISEFFRFFGLARAGVILVTGASLLPAARILAEPVTNTAVPGPLSYKADWRWMKGAVFVPTKYVNEAQQWDEYDPVINDRELHYTSIYGINCVRVFLHFGIYLKKKDALLKDIEDFLTRADKYGIKTELVFFDDCWNQPDADMLSPDYKYPAPIFGVHNSCWVVSPGENVRQHYAEYLDRLKSYVQDIVNAHRDDKRIAFWETYNEPTKSPETLQLLKDSYGWIHETGTKIPVTATGRESSGEPFSDFKSWHEYGGYDYTGTPDSLNTECMNRSGQTIPGVVEHFKNKTGFIVWEFGIGRDNCRFTWDENRDHPRKDETPKPFHGIVYPDGHPWSVDDVKALLGAEGFARAPLFTVEYFNNADFTGMAKKSVTPMIDFDLGTEEGTGSPDASAGVPQENFSVRWTGTILPPAKGTYIFYADGDNRVKLFVNSKLVLEKKTPGRREISKHIKLAGGQSAEVRIEYIHAAGDPSLHVAWSGPGFARRTLTPINNASVP
ncbi:MAG: PA14 domain-containing protein [Limisphaerales bacterium]